MTDMVGFFWVFLKACLFSTGGMGPLPALHHDLISSGLASERQFTEALAVGQFTPGPSGLWVVSLATLMAGLPGALLATFAVVLPPVLVLVVQRLYRRVANHPAAQGALDGLMLAIIGVGFVVLLELFLRSGVNVGLIGLAGLSLAVGLTRRVPAIVIMFVSALAGIVLASVH
jgi:chromate transporter